MATMGAERLFRLAVTPRAVRLRDRNMVLGTEYTHTFANTRSHTHFYTRTHARKHARTLARTLTHSYARTGAGSDESRRDRPMRGRERAAWRERERVGATARSGAEARGSRTQPRGGCHGALRAPQRGWRGARPPQ